MCVWRLDDGADIDDDGAHVMRQTFTPLVEKCKRLNRAMRIGTNHGSLSARILSYYGDTPRGMVESAFEFADICRCFPLHSAGLVDQNAPQHVLCLAHGLQEPEAHPLPLDPAHLSHSQVRLWTQGPGNACYHVPHARTHRPSTLVH